MADAIGAQPPQPITHRRVLAIALPVVLSNATVPLVGLVDTGVVGQLGEAVPIGAVAIGSGLLSAIFWIFGFLRLGTVGLVGQAEGAGDLAEVSAILTRALIIAGAAGFGLILCQWPVIAGALWISPASDEVESLAAVYLRIRIWAAPFTIGLYALTGWLVAQERLTAVFWVQLLTNGLNIVLNFWFVLGLDWGVGGVAVASVLAEIAGFALALWYCRSAFDRVDWRDWVRVFDRGKLIRMALLNKDILIRSALLVAIFQSFILLSGDFGDVTLAANQVLIQFVFLTSYAMDGFTTAAETLIARAFGRRDPARVRRAAVVTSFWGGVVSVVAAVAFVIWGPAIVDLLAKAPDVQVEARLYLWWMVFGPVVGWAAWMLDGIFIGATKGRDMRNMMIVSAVTYVVAVWALIPLWGNHGLWAALLISFAMRGVTLAFRYPALERSAAG